MLRNLCTQVDRAAEVVDLGVLGVQSLGFTELGECIDEALAGLEVVGRRRVAR